MELEINNYAFAGSGLEEFYKSLSGHYNQVYDNLEGLFAEDIARHWGLACSAPRAVITNIEKTGKEVCLTVAEYDHDVESFFSQVANLFNLSFFLY